MMSEIKSKLVINQKTDFTPMALVRWLNKTYKTKKSGTVFTMQDVQQYEIRGYLPKQYGGHNIETLVDADVGIKVLRIDFPKETNGS